MKFVINTVEKRSTNPSLKNLLREGCTKQNEKAKCCPLKYAYETLGRNYLITTFFENRRFSSFFKCEQTNKNQGKTIQPIKIFKTIELT